MGARHLTKIPTPSWMTRSTDLPMLRNPKELSTDWMIQFGPASRGTMTTHAFETGPKAAMRYLAVAVPSEGVPSAWLIYFRHTAKEGDFKDGGLLQLGGGDYLEGRMQVIKQIVASGKNVGVVIPLAFGSAGEFAGNEAFVMRCLDEVETDLYGGPKNLPILAASNSDGIFQLQGFLKGLGRLRGRLKAIYDFDGSLHVGAGGISLAVPGVRTFRYDGGHSPTPESFLRTTTMEDFLAARMAQSPTRVPLALSRWRRHAHFNQIRPRNNPEARQKFGNPENEAMNMNDKNWLHHRIPGCMLHHGLASTSGI